MTKNVSLLVALFWMGLVAVSSAQEHKEVYSAFASQTNNLTRTTALEIIIDRWSSDVQRARLFAAMSQGGQEALTKELVKQETTGVLRIMGGTGAGGRSQFQLRYARAFDSVDKREIVLATDRYIQFGDARRNPTTEENNISYVTLVLDKDGNGTGTIMVGARLKLEEGRFELQDVVTNPIRLLKVTKK